MKLPQISIAKLMVAVGVVALNLAFARILVLYNPEMLTGVALIVLALQIGLFRILQNRGRAFWVGFVLCGLTSMMGLVWALRSPGVILVSSTGGYFKEEEPPMYGALCEYRDVATERVFYPILNSLHIDPMSNRDSKLLQASFMGFNAVVWFLPQIVVAIFGGLLTSLNGRRWGKVRSGRPHLHATSGVSSSAR